MVNGQWSIRKAFTIPADYYPSRLQYYNFTDSQGVNVGSKILSFNFLKISDAKSIKKGVLETFSISLIFLILSLITMYPAPMHWNTQMAGGSWDTGQNLWNFWWIEKSIDHGNFFPFFTDMIYYPQGVGLSFHTLQLLNGYEAVALHKIFDVSLPGAYNDILLLSSVTAGLTSYLLTKHFSHNTLSSILASIVVVFSPIHISRMHFGHLEIFSGLQFIPLIALFAILVIEKEKWYFALLTGLALALTGWQSLHLALGAAFFTFLFFASFGYKKYRRAFGYLLITIGVTFVLMLPLIIPMLHDLRDFQSQTSLQSASSTDLLNLIIPDQSVSAFWRFILGNIFHKPFVDYFQVHSQNTAFLGIGVIILTIFSVIFISFKKLWQWWLIAVIFIVLSLGPYLIIKGHTLFPLPYLYISKIPFLGFGRVPARWMVFPIICLGVAIGCLGAAFAKRGLVHQGILLLCGILIFLESLAIPIKLDDRLENAPVYYEKLAQTTSWGGVLDIP
jgi:hypothetical protein